MEFLLENIQMQNNVIRLCQAYAREFGANFISLMPANLYGPNDNFDLLSPHALSPLLRKAHEAKRRGKRKVLVWGSGKAPREFLPSQPQ